MARQQFQTLTEPMFYILLALHSERNGSGIVEFVKYVTNSRVSLAPGTLYALLSQFLENDYIIRVKSDSPGKNYIITEAGKELLESEKNRIQLLINDYNKIIY